MTAAESLRSGANRAFSRNLHLHVHRRLNPEPANAQFPLTEIVDELLPDGGQQVRVRPRPSRSVPAFRRV